MTRAERNDTKRQIRARSGGPGTAGTPVVSSFMMPSAKPRDRAARRNEAKIRRRTILGSAAA